MVSCIIVIELVVTKVTHTTHLWWMSPVEGLGPVWVWASSLPYLSPLLSEERDEVCLWDKRLQLPKRLLHELWSLRVSYSQAYLKTCFFVKAHRTILNEVVKLYWSYTELSLSMQMCFLKGRTTDKHLTSHQVLEFSSGGKSHKGWRQRLLGHKRQEGHLFNETKEPFVFSPRTSRARWVEADGGFWQLCLLLSAFCSICRTL